MGLYIVLYSLTALLCYGIIVKAYKAFKNADIEEKMEEIENIEEQNGKIIEFKKIHKGNINKKRKKIKDFTKE